MTSDATATFILWKCHKNEKKVDLDQSMQQMKLKKDELSFYRQLASWCKGPFNFTVKYTRSVCQTIGDKVFICLTHVKSQAPQNFS